MDNSSLEARKQINPIIEGIKSEMNSKRTYFYLPGTHYNITPHWLLGFVEGDGWFSFSSRERLFTFGVIQKGNKALLESIKDFFNNLASQCFAEQWILDNRDSFSPPRFSVIIKDFFIWL